MSKKRERRNALLQEKRTGIWTPEKEIQLRKLEAGIKESERKKLERSEYNVQKEYERHSAHLLRRENIDDLLRRRSELLYERDNNICWTVSKHYTLEAIQERIRRFNTAKKHLATTMAGKE